MVPRTLIETIDIIPEESRKRIAECLFRAYVELTPIDVILTGAGYSLIPSLSSEMFRYYQQFRPKTNECNPNQD